MPGAELKHFTINQNTNKEASEAWDHWKRNGVNISDKICQLIKQARKQEILSEQYGGQTPTEAFCADNNNEQSDSLLPKNREHLTNAYVRNLTEEQALSLFSALEEDRDIIREYFDIRYNSKSKPIRAVRKLSTITKKEEPPLTPEESQRYQELVNIFENGSIEQVSKLENWATEDNLKFLREPSNRWRLEGLAASIVRKERASRAAAIQKSGQ